MIAVTQERGDKIRQPALPAGPPVPLREAPQHYQHHHTPDKSQEQHLHQQFRKAEPPVSGGTSRVAMMRSSLVLVMVGLAVASALSLERQKRQSGRSNVQVNNPRALLLVRRFN